MNVIAKKVMANETFFAELHLINSVSSRYTFLSISQNIEFSILLTNE